MKKILFDFGEGLKEYEYSEKVAQRLEDKHFLGTADALEIAVNKRLGQLRRIKERKLKK